VFRAGSENIDELHLKVREGISKLRGLDIGDELAVEILGQLVEGRRTITEIVDHIYGVTTSDEGFYSSYSRVRREIRKLESKGLVSGKLFGKEKPYRLTELAVINLARIGGEAKQLGVLPRTDITLYTATGLSALPVLFLARGLLALSNPETATAFGCFCVLLGLSLGRFLGTLRRVF
jgi:hypothetical protein